MNPLYELISSSGHKKKLKAKRLACLFGESNIMSLRDCDIESQIIICIKKFLHCTTLL